MRKILPLFFCAILLPLCAHARHKEKKPEAPQDAPPGELVSKYWLDDPIVVGATFGIPSHLFTIDSGHGSGTSRNTDYAPPQSFDMTLSVGFGPWMIAYKFPLPQSKGDPDTYGHTNYTDLGFDFGRGRWAGTLYYQKYNGFYTDLKGNMNTFSHVSTGSSANTTTDNNANPNDPSAPLPHSYLKRPDIATNHVGAIAWHCFRIVGPADCQAFKITFHTMFEKPTPGFNLDIAHSLFFDHVDITGSSPFVPSQTAEQFGRAARLTGYNANTYGLGLGLAFSYVFTGSHFFIDEMMSYGGGAQRQKNDFGLDYHEWNTRYADNFNMHFGFSYRGDWNQAGFRFLLNTTTAKTADAKINSSNLAIEFNYVRTI